MLVTSATAVAFTVTGLVIVVWSVASGRNLSGGAILVVVQTASALLAKRIIHAESMVFTLALLCTYLLAAVQMVAGSLMLIFRSLAD